jgi:hypothetical protein
VWKLKGTRINVITRASAISAEIAPATELSLSKHTPATMPATIANAAIRIPTKIPIAILFLLLILNVLVWEFECE